jgi:hypothetical protein
MPTRYVWSHILPGMRYLHRLKKRMAEVGFLADDPLLRMVNRVYESLEASQEELRNLAREDRKPD